MAHFSDEPWADFARGINQPDANTAIQKHLAEECKECTRTLATWSQFHEFTTMESTYAVPPDAVRVVNLQFEAMHRREGKRWTLGKLIFDSFREPVMAGIRSGRASARQVVYEVNDLIVDMRFDRQPRSSRVSIVGQVLAKGASQRSLHNATVILWTEKGDPVAAVKTTAFGEFLLEFELQNHLRLSIEGTGRSPVRIPLANLKESES